MKDLLSLFATEIAKIDDGAGKLFPANKPSGFLLKSATKPVADTIMQLAAMPITIDLDNFTNPHSPENPTGSLIETQRFRAYADPVPKVSSIFQTSPKSTERLWGSLLRASRSENSYSIEVLSDAITTYDNFKWSGTTYSPNPWYPVFARPYNWYNLAKDAKNFTTMVLDFGKDAETQSNYILINDKKTGLAWRSFADDSVISEMEIKGTLQSIEIKIMKVDFYRPWMMYEVVGLPKLQMPSLDSAFFSTGTFNNNDGQLPLIATSMLIGTDVKVKGQLTDEDRQFLNSNAGKQISIGPFTLSAESMLPEYEEDNQQSATVSAPNNILQVIGYLSQLMPRLPK